ncbi:hypothetical protein Alg130_11704 [Pyrenophora tritici-repentis]|uniref:Uncharacterized protein n=1 Tax=Pyrenophora tritici-repentis TaxID=45151 RepID=A0A5M9L3W4_9PLEO|nr:hypothetical protein PtrV1_06948 [Pyrenophora tritici-repentis]KAF7447997.1 hypothetical protein A1F99_073610 [Pyrenophora tritici-repentis]KAF7571702.1 hypothetical protein PtrM4_092020 [Pyrenophora tritici-repentis]KAI0569247.1 hypothetical protein Alg215_11752 [Pyrenophora tritici-repentis]KAI0569291.1 hypothetical protein Alg130_11704 [Pyrenophora tritici-repentis]
MQLSTLTILASLAFGVAAMPQPNVRPQTIVVPPTCQTRRLPDLTCCCDKNTPNCVCEHGCVFPKVNPYCGSAPPAGTR